MPPCASLAAHVCFRAVSDHEVVALLISDWLKPAWRDVSANDDDPLALRLGAVLIGGGVGWLDSVSDLIGGGFGIS
jgi:hypothetical protein